MAIKHTIRNGKGNLVEVELTPRKAIKAHCLECCALYSPKCLNVPRLIALFFHFVWVTPILSAKKPGMSAAIG